MGQDTSNIVESQNNVLKKDRELSVLDLLDIIWHQVMSTRAERFVLPRNFVARGIIETSYFPGLLREQDKLSQQGTALSSTKLVICVQELGQSRRVCVVNIVARECTCER